MPTGFQTGASPAKTYILPPAAAPDISSAGCGNGASFLHWPWDSRWGAGRMVTAIISRYRQDGLANLTIALSLKHGEMTACSHGRQPGGQIQQRSNSYQITLIANWIWREVVAVESNKPGVKPPVLPSPL